LLHIIEEKMLQCAPTERATIDVIKTDLWNIVESIPKESNPDELSQDLAYIRRDDSAPSLGAPRDISLYEVTRELTTDNPDTTTGDGSDTGLMMRTRSQRLRRENAKQSEDSRDAAPSTDEQGISEILAGNATAATTSKEAKSQFPQAVFESEAERVPREDAASFHVTEVSQPTTRTNGTRKKRFSQKSKRWFREPLIHLKRIWKG
jgi:hypothetical protein